MDAELRPAPATGEDWARRLDLPLVGPALTSTQVLNSLEAARRLHLGSATVRPCDLDLAVRTLDGSSVRIACVCGFPHGSQSTATKLYEARDLLRRGARQISAVLATSKLLSREFQYIQTELLQLAETCHKDGALLDVVLENAYLSDELKTIACRCAERAEADSVATSTGFAPSGCTLADVQLMRAQLPEEMALRAEGAIGTLDHLLELWNAGATVFSTQAAADILDEWQARQAPAAGVHPA